MAVSEEGEETTSHENEWEVATKMADNGEVEEASSRGNEWEVVSLTASTYAIAPDRKGEESIHEKGSTIRENEEAETSRALFMSAHFVFPPSEHENLPIELENIEIPNEVKDDEHVAQVSPPKEDKSDQKEDKEDENWKIEGLNMPEEFPGIQFFDEKGNRGLSIDDNEHDLYATSKFSSFHSEHDGSMVLNELIELEPSNHGINPTSMLSQSPNSGKEDELDNSELPCGAWWKRRVASFYTQAKETNAFWSVFVAAAVMGLVLLGQRWQQERWQVLQQRWQLSVGNEKPGRILSRLKDVIVSGSRRGTYITTSSADR